VTPARRVRALSIHAAYRCRHTGACCTSGWAIPVEPEAEERLREALRSGSLRPAEPDEVRPDATSPIGLTGKGVPSGRLFRRVAGLAHGVRVLLRTDAAGRCVFRDPRPSQEGGCAVHRALGATALPSACRHFPRVVTLTPLGVSVTLSHYCPTAAGLLFAVPRSSPFVTPRSPLLVIPRSPVTPGDEESAGPATPRDPELRIVDDPPAFPAEWPWEGLDARDALPPLLRPGVLMDWPSLERWERFAVSALAEEGRTPEAALDLLSAAAEEARRWTTERGAFGGFFEGVLETVAAGGCPGEPALHGALQNGLRSPRNPASRGSRGVRAWRLTADCVPHGSLLPAAPEGLDEADEHYVVPVWPGFSQPVRHWLATKAFASWTALQGDGLRSTVASLRIALAVLRVEAARGAAEAARVLDVPILKEAVRRADLLLVHLADPQALATRLGRVEAAEHLTAAW
jgi:hypothetical protein